MPVEEIKTVKYYSINKNGRIRSTSGQDKDQQYESLWGILVGIELVEDSFEGKKNYKYQFKLEDPLHDHLEILQVGEASSAARGIILSLMSIPGRINLVHFSPYQKTVDDNAYTNVWVKHADKTGQAWQEIEWDKKLTDHLPPQKEVRFGDRVELDDWERRKYIRGIAARIKKTKLNLREDQVEQSGLKSTESITPDGEIVDKASATRAVYEDPRPAPEKVTQRPQELHSKENEDGYKSVFDDADDDLPF